MRHIGGKTSVNPRPPGSENNWVILFSSSLLLQVDLTYIQLFVGSREGALDVLAQAIRVLSERHDYVGKLVPFSVTLEPGACFCHNATAISGFRTLISRIVKWL